MVFLTVEEVFALAEEVANPPRPNSHPLQVWPAYGLLVRFAAFTGLDFTRANIIMVCLPLVLISATFTHLNARMSLNRQAARRAAGKTNAPSGDNAAMMQQQMQMMNKMMLWVFPVMIIASGFLWHIGLLFYMLTNNVWTFFQSMWLNNKMDREEAAEEARKVELKRTTAPAPGARTKDRRTKKQRKQGK